MATITIPNVATQQEIRCDGLICRNSLDIGEDNPLQKYTVILDRMAEPQDATGKRVGARQRIPSYNVPMATLLQDEVTVGELTLSCAVVMALVNAMVDKYKAADLQ